MTQFNQVLKEFEVGNSLKLIDAVYTLDQLKQLRQCVKRKNKTEQGHIGHFENIVLITDACLNKNDSQQVIYGAVTARDHVLRLSNEKYIDATYYNLSRSGEMTFTLHHLLQDEYREESTACIEDCLIELINEEDFWHSFTFKNVVILSNGYYWYPSFTFHYQLLSVLINQAKSLKKLSVSLISTPPGSYKTKKSPSCDQSNRVVLNSKSMLDESGYKNQFHQFLNVAIGLKSLNIVPGEPVSSFMQELNEILIVHPNLKSLGLENMFLREREYKALNVLLNENYNIRALKLLEPISNELKRMHASLLDKLLLSGLERFRLQQLTQGKLINIAKEAIENGDINQLIFVVGPEVNRRKINSKKMFENLYHTLPDVYKRFWDYTKICAKDFKLALWQKVENDPSQTVGCYLLKKAIENENGLMIINLMEAGANIYEYFRVYETRKSLLALLDESNAALTSEWKKILAKKLQQDLCYFFPAIQRILSTEVLSGFEGLKLHLDKYLGTWLNRSRWPNFVKIITGVYFCFEERRDEWENAAGKIANAIDIGIKGEFKMKLLALEELQDAVEDLIETSMFRKCGFLGRSNLNDGLVACGKELKNEIKKSKRQLLMR